MKRKKLKRRELKISKRELSVINSIKKDIDKSSKGFKNLFILGTDNKARVRFLSDLGKAIVVPEHDKFGEMYPTPCLAKNFDKVCKYCEKEGIRLRDTFVWTIWDYEAKEKKILKAPATRQSVVPHLCSAFETYGTLLTRDFVISKRGKRQNTTYSVMALDKEEFKKKKKPFTRDEVLELCVESSSEYNYDDIEKLDDFEEQEEEEYENEEEEYEDEDEDLEEEKESKDENFEYEIDEDEDEDEENEDEDEEKGEEEEEEEEKPRKKIKRKVKRRK